MTWSISLKYMTKKNEKNITITILGTIPSKNPSNIPTLQKPRDPDALGVGPGGSSRGFPQGLQHRHAVPATRCLQGGGDTCGAAAKDQQVVETWHWDVEGKHVGMKRIKWMK